MNKVIKTILWLALAFLLVAVGVAVMSFSRGSLMSATTGNFGYDDSGDYRGEAVADMSYAQTTGLSSAEAGGTVQSFVKSLSVSKSSVPSSQAPTAADATVERMVVKTGALSVVVKDVAEAIKTISQYAVKQKGYIVASNVYKRGLAPYGTLTIKIPAVNFDSGLNEIKALGEVVSNSVNGQDVTEEYVDLDAQLKNLQATEKQFLTILNKAVKIEDILAVQRELTQVRGQIEQLQGRMKYLKSSADMSTITVDLATDPSVLPSVDNSKTWKPWAIVKEATRSLLAAGKSLVNFLIWLVVFVPVWAVIALVVWVVAKVVNKIKNRGKFKLE
ncbi:MAG: hypothetical protein A3J93_03500 [Candidatus Magasanikbacteria bacterium RIFOXYC2_FULL_42_28]|uniref:DUF4349 domain-containing protein n=1 Tax=Candidatus Magasanikbacteria bacterium RIFOXYC2_FULL_42_28 TaxID=1798704 RepID=A0A1F6NV27_9BACT|nr:MAG: hypothetical protein A3J93_03500 [Candidatus Magasanikbacteria bacterium RIFOXYC2_FULL_42_28]